MTNLGDRTPELGCSAHLNRKGAVVRPICVKWGGVGGCWLRLLVNVRIHFLIKTHTHTHNYRSDYCLGFNIRVGGGHFSLHPLVDLSEHIM